MSDTTTCHRTAKPGDAIEISGIRFEVISVERQRLRVKITAPKNVKIRSLARNGERRYTEG